MYTKGMITLIQSHTPVCVYPEFNSNLDAITSFLIWTKDFHSALRARDPLGLGFDDDANTLLHLVWRLLDFDPLQRLSASHALNHPYFVSTPHWKPIFLHTQLFSGTDVTPEQQHALEHQRLDPRVYMSSDMVSEFVCPKCGKRFDDHVSREFNC